MCNNYGKILKYSTIIVLIINCVKGGFLKFDGLIKFNENEYCKNSTYNKRFAIIVHGWRESCSIPWVIKLTENLKKYRGGCIMCMDYHIIARIPNYFILAAHSLDISSVLTKKLQKLENSGFDPNQGYMFGFSLGGRIVIEAGRMFGKQKLSEIDTCDMAGPGFDKRLKKYFDPKDSAKNVQCIHTSSDKGTKERNCHQNWNMGYCGNYQLAANKKNSEYGSHGLCTEFYNSAFENNFYAEIKPKQCNNVKINYKYLPNYFKMGYMENRKYYIHGEFYASTTKYYPYTNNITKPNELSSSSIQLQSIYENHYNNEDEEENTYKVIVIFGDKLKYFRKRKSLINFKKN